VGRAEIPPRDGLAGLANTDETLYKGADIVVTGGSFTIGTGVEFTESWPQWVSRRTGRRVLNLAANGWDVYQFPRVVARYAPAASRDGSSSPSR